MMVFYSNLFLVIANLIPQNVLSKSLIIPNDGMKLLKIPFMKIHEIQILSFAGELFRGLEQIQNKQYESAKVILMNIEQKNPNLIEPKVFLSYLSIRNAEFENAYATLTDALNISSNPKDQSYYIITNNIASLSSYIDLLIPIADTYSKAAFLYLTYAYYSINDIKKAKEYYARVHEFVSLLEMDEKYIFEKMNLRTNNFANLN